MRNIIHNNGRFCFSDFVRDIEILISMQEKMNDFIQYWAIRENGTKIADYSHEVKIWAQSCKCQGYTRSHLRMAFIHLRGLTYNPVAPSGYHNKRKII